jgi:hypothetical protein
MPGRTSRRAHKPRELRRRVVLTARLRQANDWSDASILNMSSRGLLIHTTRPLERGSWVELRREELTIRAEVVWRSGGKVGLRAEDRLPIEEIACDGTDWSAETASRQPPANAQRRPDSRARGRSIEFASVVAGSLVMVAVAGLLVQRAFAAPLAIVAEALR